MNTDKLNNWISIAANLGVLIGIIFLILEIRLNTETMQADAYDARTNAILDTHLMVTESENLQAALAKINWDSGFCNPSKELIDNLSEQERIVVKAFLTASWRRFDSQYSQYNRGTLSSVPFFSQTLPAMRDFHTWLDLFEVRTGRGSQILQEFQQQLEGIECR